MSDLLNIIIVDTPINPFDQNEQRNIVERRVRNGKTQFKIWLYLNGDDLPYVRRVKYVLHSSYKQPEFIISKLPSNPNCLFSFWAWGTFIVKAVVEDKSKKLYYFEHRLMFDKRLQKNDFRIRDLQPDI